MASEPSSLVLAYLLGIASGVALAVSGMGLLLYGLAP